MVNRIWLLVEWVEENNAFPVYSVVNVNKFSYSEKDLQSGEMIMLSLKQYDAPRRAKIIKFSDDKQQLKEQKFLLERQDQQIKNVLQVCMRTINELKSDQVQNGSLQHSVMTGSNSNILHVMTANNENSDRDEEEKNPRNKSSNKYSHQAHRQNESVEGKRHLRKDTKSPCVNHVHRSLISSTPIKGKNTNIRDQILLTFDQGTQTEGNWTSPASAKIEDLEIVLKHLYTRFQALIMKVNNNDNGVIQMLETKEIDVSYNYTEQAHNNCDSWVAPKNLVQNVEIENNVQGDDVNIDDACAIGPNESENHSVSKSAVKEEIDRNNENNENSGVRRMSAQTTYLNEMVPIGSGHAVVPARLLNEIDWQSHTTATRQLLQAIFPRKVLATHSLTGKQSPAHRNKPAKKLLDPNLVNDIIWMVSSKSGVSKNLVRNTITVKCTDEAKLYRNRQQYRFLRAEKKHRNDENLPPSLANSSDESTNNLMP